LSSENIDIENQVAEYEDKAFYHQVGTEEYTLALEYHKKAFELYDEEACGL